MKDCFNFHSFKQFLCHLDKNKQMNKQKNNNCNIKNMIVSVYITFDFTVRQTMSMR